MIQFIKYFKNIFIFVKINWTYTWRSEDVLNVFWTSYVRSIYFDEQEDIF